jgi:hypothetical protein
MRWWRAFETEKRRPITHNLAKSRTFEKAASVEFFASKRMSCQGASVAASAAAEEL